MHLRLLLVSILLWALPTRVQAYRTLTDLPALAAAHGAPVAWRAFPIELEVFGQELDPADAVATRDALEAATELWNQAACTRDALAVPGPTGERATSEDTRNTVQWVHSGWSMHGARNAVAITESSYVASRDSEILAGDIYLNAETLTWSSEMLSHLDGVLAHELGHVLGLAHPCEPDGADGAPICDASVEMTLMHPLYDATRSALTADDEDGACFLYPDGPIELTAPTTQHDMGGCTVAQPSHTRAPASLVLMFAFAALRIRRRHLLLSKCTAA